MDKVVIIGAGPAGLSAAHELLSRGGKKNDAEKGVSDGAKDAAANATNNTKKYEVTVLEATQEIGGISRTVCHNGLRMDIGGHRFFSKEERVNKWWHERMPLQGVPTFDDVELSRKPKLSKNGPDPAKTDRVMLHRQRISRIFYGQQFFDYPIVLSTKTLGKFGMKRTLQVIASYLKAQLPFCKLPETSLENFYINRFGKKLYSMFFENYTEKLWGRHPSEIAADWGAQRVKGLSISVLLKNALQHIGKKHNASKGDKNKQETSLISAFEYPKLGPGQLWEQAAKEVEELGANLERGKKVVQIKVDEPAPDTSATLKDGEHDAEPAAAATDAAASSATAAAASPQAAATTDAPAATGTAVPAADTSPPKVEVTCADGSTYKCDYVFSSMPLAELVASVQGVPQDIKKIASGLPYRDFLTVGLLVKNLAISYKDKSAKSETHGLGGIIADNWIYVQEGSVDVGRVQIFNNWSPYMLPDPANQVWLGLEFFCNDGDKLSSLSDEQAIEHAHKELAKIGLITPDEPVLDAHVERVPKAYPAYFDSYSSIDKIVDWANKQPWLFCVGRNGQHRYNNMDHSMMTSFLAVDCLLSNKADKSAIWQVNAEAHYHEESDDKQS